MNNQAEGHADSVRWVHPMLKPLSVDRQGPFLALEDGGLATIDDAGWRISRDDGVTWSSPTPVCPGVPRLNGEPACHYLLRTPHGVSRFMVPRGIVDGCFGG